MLKTKKLFKRLRKKAPKFSPTLPVFPRVEVRFTFSFRSVLQKFLKLVYLHTPRVRISKLGLLTFLGVILTSAVFTFWLTILKDLPSPHELKNRKVNVSTKIYDRNGTILYQIYKDQNRTPVTLSQIPGIVRSATLAAEDAEFYNHPGVSIKGIVRSVFKNTTQGAKMGGSTITQQLVKNALLTPEQTWTRKIKEVILSVQVEMTFTKDQIFEMYLNEVSYGGSAFGIEEASRSYFNKHVEELTLGEAALLAGLPKSPTTYSPFGTNPDLATERQKEVLRLMRENGFITKEDQVKAEEEKITFAPNEINIKAPHFVMYVKDQLAQKYGEEAVATGGLTVITTLDYEIQQMAEKVVAKNIDSLKRYRVGNGAVIIMHPQTGEILAMVGSKDYFDTKNDGNVNVTTSPRQPGSSIKPVEYAYALSNSVTPATVIGDNPTKFLIPGQPVYTPKNYDNKFRGNLTIRSALAESRNIPPVKLAATFGVDKLIELGRKMGITTWKDPSQYGLSLTLGGGEVKLIDLSQVYATIANMGTKPGIITIAQVIDYKGKILEEAKCFDHETSCGGESVLDPRVSFMLIDILRDNNARAPSFGFHSALVIPNHPEVAVKTGTSNDMRDNLTVGFNQKYLVATWVGNNDGSPMGGITSGVTGAAPIWNEIMRALLAKEESIAWLPPKGLAFLPICTGNSNTGRSEWFFEEAKPREACRFESIGLYPKKQIISEVVATKTPEPAVAQH